MGIEDNGIIIYAVAKLHLFSHSTESTTELFHAQLLCLC